MKLNVIYNEDNRETMARLPDNCIDAIVTDPPYGLRFMGKKWDYNVPSVEVWKEVLRVLKPGGYLLAFGGTRTYHRLVVNIEDAGFEIRDMLQWLYGSGFPKSLDISKAIDKAAGAEREVVKYDRYKDGRERKMQQNGKSIFDGRNGNTTTIPATPEAKQWEGFGSALKPSNEPVVLARKKLSEKTLAANVLKWGTGGLNIDKCRIPTKPRTTHKNGNIKGSEKDSNCYGYYKEGYSSNGAQGRWPANVIHDGSPEVLRGFPVTATGGPAKARTNKIYDGYGLKPIPNDPNKYNGGDSGSAARYFYCAKADATERNFGLKRHGRKNRHATVKPLALMRYLVRLITPPGGIVYDPFCGSGTTCVACMEEGFYYIGSEINAEDAENARLRTEAKRNLFSVSGEE